MKDSIILYRNKEKIKELMEVFNKIKTEVDIKMTNSYIKIPTNIRIKLPENEQERLINHTLYEESENGNKTVIFSFNM